VTVWVDHQAHLDRTLFTSAALGAAGKVAIGQPSSSVAARSGVLGHLSNRSAPSRRQRQEGCRAGVLARDSPPRHEASASIARQGKILSSEETSAANCAAAA